MRSKLIVNRFLQLRSRMLVETICAHVSVHCGSSAFDGESNRRGGETDLARTKFPQHMPRPLPTFGRDCLSLEHRELLITINAIESLSINNSGNQPVQTTYPLQPNIRLGVQGCAFNIRARCGRDPSRTVYTTTRSGQSKPMCMVLTYSSLRQACDESQ